jgi:hypothetical protein
MIEPRFRGEKCEKVTAPRWSGGGVPAGGKRPGTLRVVGTHWAFWSSCHLLYDQGGVPSRTIPGLTSSYKMQAFHSARHRLSDLLPCGKARAIIDPQFLLALFLFLHPVCKL